MKKKTPEEVQDSSTPLPTPPPPLRIFVNRNLRMDTIKAIGFDMDYTLARYRRDNLEELAHRLTVEKLVARGYPEDIRKFKYDPSFVIRGLTVDKQLGNILKLDRHNHPTRVFHGRRSLSKSERRSLYRREKLRFIPPRFAVVDTLFSLPEMCLYADLVEYFEAVRGRGADTWQLFDDIRECIDEAHRDDSLKTIVKGNLDLYVEKDPLLGRMLHKLRSAGKRLFLLTNSHWKYTNTLMSHLLDGAMPEYPTWRHYFHIIVVGAGKPGFFTEDEPLAEIDEAGHPISRPVKTLKKGHIYQGGNLRDFERALKLSGEEVLYVGDHIYADILRSKKTSLWRTALVIEELEDELAHSIEHRAELQELTALEARRRELDDEINLLRHHLAWLEQEEGAAAARASAEYARMRSERDQHKRAVKGVLGKLSALHQRIGVAFNPNWGMVFKEGRENTRFGEQVEDYACVYMSRVTNLFFYSSYQYFRSPRDYMPHERSWPRPPQK